MMAKPQWMTDVLQRLTGLSQELAGAFRPATIIELVARAITEQLAPERLSIMLLDVDSNRLVVAYHDGPRPATTDEPLLQLALRRGPLVIPEHVAAGAPGSRCCPPPGSIRWPGWSQHPPGPPWRCAPASAS